VNRRRLLDARVRAAIRELGGSYSPTLTPPMDRQETGALVSDGRRPSRRAALLLGATATALLVGGVLYATLDTPRHGPAAGDREGLAAPRIVEGGGPLTLFSSETAEQWVRNSDYVVQASVIDERKVNEGDARVVGRTVSLKVEEIIWTRVDADHALPAQFELPAHGWLRTGDGEVPIASMGTPRLEVNHSYVVALVWAPRLCSQGDRPEPAHWIPLGPSAVIPYDNDRIGYGESEGRSVSGDIDQSAPGSIERDFTGEGITGVASLLRQQAPHPKDDVFPTPAC